jgi:hypothetical protein
LYSVTRAQVENLPKVLKKIEVRFAPLSLLTAACKKELPTELVDKVLSYTPKTQQSLVYQYRDTTEELTQAQKMLELCEGKPPKTIIDVLVEESRNAND